MSFMSKCRACEDVAYVENDTWHYVSNEGTFHGRKLASVMPLLYNIAHTHRTHSAKYGFRTATGQWSNLAKNFVQNI